MASPRGPAARTPLIDPAQLDLAAPPTTDEPSGPIWSELSGAKPSCTSGSASSGDEQEPWADMYVHLPESPNVLQRLVFPARVQIAYLRRLASAFSWRYVLAVISVYGLNQGVGEAFFYFAFDFLCADDLRLSPARASELGGLAHGPWELKAIFGMLSDAFPIFGYKRAPCKCSSSLCVFCCHLCTKLLPPVQTS